MDQLSNFYSMGWLPFAGPFLVVAIIWSLFWKGVALWRAAKQGELLWFLAFLLLNTLGILEIIYIFAFSQKKETAAPPT